MCSAGKHFAGQLTCILLKTLLKNAYYLSLPVVFGAVLSHKAAARLSGVDSLHWATTIVLALAVWVIYTADRLLDVRKPGFPPTPRHLFHRNHALVLWQAVGAAALLALILTFWLPTAVIKFGAVLFLICGLYIGMVFKLPAHHPALLLKEPLVALLYSAGVWGSVWTQRPAIGWVDMTEAAMFAAVAFQNLLLFSIMEIQEKPRQTSFSIATGLGLPFSDMLLRWLTFIVGIAAMIICFTNNDPGGGPRFAQRLAIMLAIMSTVLYVIQRYPAYYLRHERYRWLGDAVFWLPALVL